MFIYLKAKLAARKARKEQEVNRRAKEEAQQKILEEQSRLASSNKPKDMDDIVLPDIIVAKDGMEITVRFSTFSHYIMVDSFMISHLSFGCQQ